jgi:hypothetical protein
MVLPVPPWARPGSYSDDDRSRYRRAIDTDTRGTCCGSREPHEHSWARLPAAGLGVRYRCTGCGRVESVLFVYPLARLPLEDIDQVFVQEYGGRLDATAQGPGNDQAQGGC